MTGTASPYEVVSLLVNTLGFFAVLYLIRRTRTQYTAVGGGAATILERMAAWRHFRTEIERLIYHTGSIGLGIWGAMLPDNSTAYGHASMSFRLTLGIIMLVWSLLDIRCDRGMWDRLRSRRGRPR